MARSRSAASASWTSVRLPEINRKYTARQHFDRPGDILMPGLINTHTHAAMSLFRGLADDLRLQDWLEKYIFPAEAKNVDAGFVILGHPLGLPSK